jgi:hypothetical protein
VLPSRLILFDLTFSQFMYYQLCDMGKLFKPVFFMDEEK